jgi:hypothetical protein
VLPNLGQAAPFFGVAALAIDTVAVRIKPMATIPVKTFFVCTIAEANLFFHSVNALFDKTNYIITEIDEYAFRNGE